MAKKPVVLLVHGMGSAEPPDEANNKLGSFGTEFVDSLNATLTHFSKHADDSIENHVTIEEFHYNDTFEQIRSAMAEQAQDLRTRLNNIEAVFTNGRFLNNFVGKLNGWEAKFAGSGDGEEGEDFFYTHWLDVLFYTTYIGEAIRAEFATQLAGLIKKNNSSKIHVIAHSLGTAVVHDALTKIYPPGGQPLPGAPAFFSVENSQLGSIWMLANVSRLVDSVVGLSDPVSANTTVKPGNGGCAKLFYNVRHELDPFTMVRRFDPRNDGSWVSEATYRLRYESIVNDIVVDANTHAFTQYMKDPNVSLRLLESLIGSSKFKTTVDETEELLTAHAESSINGAFARLQQEFSRVDITDLDTIEDFLTAGEQFRTAISSIKQQLQG